MFIFADSYEDARGMIDDPLLYKHINQLVIRLADFHHFQVELQEYENMYLLNKETKTGYRVI